MGLASVVVSILISDVYYIAITYLVETGFAGDWRVWYVYQSVVDVSQLTWLICIACVVRMSIFLLFFSLFPIN